MSLPVIIDPKAHRQIEDAYEWWAKHRSAEQAVRWYNGFMDKLESLEENPHQYPLAPSMVFSHTKCASLRLVLAADRHTGPCSRSALTLSTSFASGTSRKDP